MEAVEMSFVIISTPFISFSSFEMQFETIQLPI